jgi:hypothetical protein
MNGPNKLTKIFKLTSRPKAIKIGHSYSKPIFYKAIRLGPVKGKEKEMEEHYKELRRHDEIYSAY